MEKGDYCLWKYSFSNGDTTFSGTGIEQNECHPLYKCTVCTEETMLECPYYRPIKSLKLCRFPGDKQRGD